MLPFDMHVFDDSAASGGPSLPDRILAQCRAYLQVSDLTPGAAAQLAARSVWRGGTQCALETRLESHVAPTPLSNFCFFPPDPRHRPGW